MPDHGGSPQRRRDAERREREGTEQEAQRHRGVREKDDLRGRWHGDRKAIYHRSDQQHRNGVAPSPRMGRGGGERREPGVRVVAAPTHAHNETLLPEWERGGERSRAGVRVVPGVGSRRRSEKTVGINPGRRRLSPPQSPPARTGPSPSSSVPPIPSCLVSFFSRSFSVSLRLCGQRPPASSRYFPAPAFCFSS